MNSYTLETAPTQILIDVLNDPHYCGKCGKWSALYDAQFPSEPPRPKPVPRKLRQPGDGEWHGHSCHADLRWWNAPFSEADFADPADREPSGVRRGELPDGVSDDLADRLREMADRVSSGRARVRSGAGGQTIEATARATLREISDWDLGLVYEAVDRLREQSAPEPATPELRRKE